MDESSGKYGLVHGRIVHYDDYLLSPLRVYMVKVGNQHLQECHKGPLGVRPFDEIVVMVSTRCHCTDQGDVLVPLQVGSYLAGALLDPAVALKEVGIEPAFINVDDDFLVLEDRDHLFGKQEPRGDVLNPVFLFT